MNKRLENYLLIAERRPELFVNPPGQVFEILLGEEQIRETEREVGLRLEKDGLPYDWSRVGVAFQDQYLSILRDAVRFPDGTLGTYIRVLVNTAEEDIPGVVILPMIDEKILIMRHFRHATRTWHLEVPRGFGARGVTSEASARRELTEEIGTTPSGLLWLGRMHTNTGITSECVELFLARIQTCGFPELIEAISELILVSIDEFEDLVVAGDITDAFTIVAFTQGRLRGFL